MFPGIYPDYKEGALPIKAPNGLSLNNTKTLRIESNNCRMHCKFNIERDQFSLAQKFQHAYEAIEEVIGHPKYYI